MKQKLFSNNISPACAHCMHGSVSSDEQSVLCIRQGIMLPDSSCKHYVYDPLKRKPCKMVNAQTDAYKTNET